MSIQHHCSLNGNAYNGKWCMFLSTSFFFSWSSWVFYNLSKITTFSFITVAN